ncbi:MAG: hypothetical protein ACXW3L_03430 [Limisphaerales bacterium]
MESPPDWLKVRDPLSYINEAGLGRAELDSISLSIEFGAWLLIDDQEARIFAHRKVTKILGTIGMLELGSANRLIDDLQGAYTKLQATNHRHAPALISDALFRDRQRR